MCGHVGMAGHFEHKDEMTLKKLLIYDYFRGPDSTGLAALRHNGDIKIAKGAVNPLDLFDMQRYKEASGYSSARVFLGHNRAATKGGVNNINAHPFQFGNIVGAHNGTLSAKTHAKMNTLAGEEFAVDSMSIFAAIEKVGIESVIEAMKMPNDQGKCDDAYALVWINTEEGTLNFIRNGERPLWFAYQKDFKKIFWSSEFQFIRAAVETSAISYDMYKSEEGWTYFQFKENWWYRFDIKALKEGTFKEKPKPRVKELKGKEPAGVTVTHYSGGSSYSPFVQGSTTHSTIAHRGTSGTGSGTLSPRKPKGPDVLELVGDQNSPMAGFLTRSAFDDLAKYGCSWCGTDVDYEDPGVQVNTVIGSVMCPDCVGNGTNTRLIVSGDELDIITTKAA